MPTSRDEILNAALKLFEADRLLIASRVMDTLPDDMPGLAWEDEGLVDELERPAQDSEGFVPASELWKPA